jgi:transcriptional regulator CtsR
LVASSQINYVIRSASPLNGDTLLKFSGEGMGISGLSGFAWTCQRQERTTLRNLWATPLMNRISGGSLPTFQHRQLITARERLLIEVAARFQEEIGRDLLDLSPYKRDSLHAELLKRLLRSLALG